MQIDISQNEDYCLIKVLGSFDSKIHVDVRQAANRAAGLPCAKVVFDLSACPYIDSSAIGLMVELYRRLTPQGRRVGILNANEDVRRILNLTRTDTILSMYATEADIAADD